MDRDSLSTRRYLEILRANVGFDHPELWLKVAEAHHFERVLATRRERCPDCWQEKRTPFGHFIYYSNRIGLQKCAACGLIYTDVLLDRAVVIHHFEHSYKDPAYFERRRDIFDFVVRLAAERAPRSGLVLDVGGAQGDLLAALRTARPDLRLVLNDISVSACTFAHQRHGLETLAGSLLTIDSVAPVDVLMLIDVIYYEPEVDTLWQVIGRTTARNGIVIIRIPNRIQHIRLGSVLGRIVERLGGPFSETTLPFNGEHVSIFSRSYLRRRLSQGEFTRIHFLPSPLLRLEGWRTIEWFWYQIAVIVAKLTFGTVIITPSLVVVAERAESPDVGAIDPLGPGKSPR